MYSETSMHSSRHQDAHCVWAIGICICDAIALVGDNHLAAAERPFANSTSFNYFSSETHVCLIISTS